MASTSKLPKPKVSGIYGSTPDVLTILDVALLPLPESLLPIRALEERYTITIAARRIAAETCGCSKEKERETKRRKGREKRKITLGEALNAKSSSPSLRLLSSHVPRRLRIRKAISAILRISSTYFYGQPLLVGLEWLL
ncbi:uncharacterized protein LOC143903648 [Temnothorax americanus]|uniref:uncharacterized protein LOC143903648 n=1 Tax=Temnothorax americanus TaxID=1964332 RepID=UPI0040688D8D